MRNYLRGHAFIKQLMKLISGHAVVLLLMTAMASGVAKGERFLSFQKAEATITGKVTAESGGSLPGVNILLKGTTIGTVTDAEGHFSLNVPELTGTLVCSYIGSQNMEVPVNGRTSIDARSMKGDTLTNNLICYTINKLK